MKVLDSGALRGLAKILGIAGGTPTDFDDSTLQQSIDVGPILRRSRTPGELNAGIFMTGMRNTHSGAGANTLTGVLAPYTAAMAAASPMRNTWPGFGQGVPEEFDVWLLGIDGQNLAVAGNFAGGQLSLSIGAPNNAQLTPSGAGVTVPTGALVFAVRTYDIERVIGTIGVQLDEAAGLLPRIAVPFRIPRGASLIWQTETAGAGASIYDVHLLLGVFPAGFGQDFSLGAQ